MQSLGISENSKDFRMELEEGGMPTERDVLSKWSVLKHYLIEIAMILVYPVLKLKQMSYLTLINSMKLSLRNSSKQSRHE